MPININYMCRLCMAHKDTYLYNIFDEEADSLEPFPVPLSVRITECLNMQVQINDTLPKFVCFKCIFMVNMFYKFKESTDDAGLRIKTIMEAIREKQISAEKIENTSAETEIEEERPIILINRKHKLTEEDDPLALPFDPENDESLFIPENIVGDDNAGLRDVPSIIDLNQFNTSMESSNQDTVQTFDIVGPSSSFSEPNEKQRGVKIVKPISLLNNVAKPTSSGMAYKQLTVVSPMKKFIKLSKPVSLLNIISKPLTPSGVVQKQPSVGPPVKMYTQFKSKPISLLNNAVEQPNPVLNNINQQSTYSSLADIRQSIGPPMSKVAKFECKPKLVNIADQSTCSGLSHIQPKVKSPHFSHSMTSIYPAPKLVRSTPSTSSHSNQLGVISLKSDSELKSPVYLTAVPSTSTGITHERQFTTTQHLKPVLMNLSLPTISTSNNTSKLVQNIAAPKDEDKTELNIAMTELSPDLNEVEDDVDSTESLLDKNVLYMCHVCFKPFSYKSSLTRHLVIHTNLRPYVCKICSRSFSDNSNLLKHERIHGSKTPFMCKYCDKWFPENSPLIKHVAKVHGILLKDRDASDETLFKHQCGQCFKKFANKTCLNKHLHEHILQSISNQNDNNIVCQLCFKEFSNENDLWTHKMLFHGEPKYHCEFCSKTFMVKKEYQKHLKTLHDPKPFKCDVCLKTFASETGYKDHILKHINEDTLGIYECDACGSEFTERIELNNHNEICKYASSF